jgi:hypothetical protein
MRARTPEQLATAIESLVASYLDEVRQVAQQSLERALCGQAVARRPSKDKDHRSQVPKPETKRRTAAELDATCEQLCALVRARPGESIVTLAEEMGVPASTLRMYPRYPTFRSAPSDGMCERWRRATRTTSNAARCGSRYSMGSWAWTGS